MAMVVGSYVAYRGYEEWAHYRSEEYGRVLKIFTDKKQMESLFDKIDVDTSGSISADELRAVNMLKVKAMMYAPPRPSSRNGRKIDFVYLLATMSGRHSGDQVHKAKKPAAPLFLIYCSRRYTADKDSNGQLDKEGWVALVDKLLDDRAPNTADDKEEWVALVNKLLDA